MDVTSFYSVVSTLSFTLLGLWWVVAERHREWFRIPARRRMAYVVSLHFMLPGLMSLLSLVAPEQPLVWRVVFVLAGIAGVVGVFLVADTIRAEYSRMRLAIIVLWVALPVYLLVVLVALLPDMSGTIGLGPRQIEGFLLAGVVLLGLHAAWFFGTEPSPEPRTDPNAEPTTAAPSGRPPA